MFQLSAATADYEEVGYWSGRAKSHKSARMMKTAFSSGIEDGLHYHLG